MTKLGLLTIILLLLVAGAGVAFGAEPDAGEPDEAERERLAGSITINGFVERLAGNSA